MVKLFCVALLLTIITHEGLSLRCYTCHSDRSGQHCQNVPELSDTIRGSYIQKCPFYGRQIVCRSTKEIKNGKVVYIRGCASEPFDTPIGDCMDRYSKEGSVIQQCETCDTDNCNIGQIRETNLGLVSTDLNKVRFDSEEMDRLKECIGNAIITRSDPNNRPHFEKTLKGPGYLIATVANNGTEDWLRSNADYIGDSCSLTFKVKGDVPPAYIYKGIVYGPLMEDFLRHVDIQNDGLLASNWTIIKHTSRGTEGVIYNIIIVSVDQESANVLNKIGVAVIYSLKWV